MKVSLRNFRRYEEFDVDFSPNSIVLLCGNSGNGKSTILQAVAWALFGRRVVSNVEPTGKKNARVSVQVTTGTHTVYRQKSPGLLRVTVHGERDAVLENESAQAEIVRAFGSEDVWLASSYIMQDTRGTFLAASNAERMELLYKLTFSDENPNDYLEIVEREFLRAKTSFEGGCRELTLAAEAFSQASEGVDFEAGMGPEEAAAWAQRSAALQRQLLLLRQRQDARHRSMGALRQAEKDLESTRSRLSSLRFPLCPSPEVLDPAAHLSLLAAAVNRAQQIAGARAKISSLKAKVSNFVSVANVSPAVESDTVLQEELGRALAAENARAQGAARAKQLGVAYQAEALASARRLLSDSLAAQPKIRRLALERALGAAKMALEKLQGQKISPLSLVSGQLEEEKNALAAAQEALRQAEETARRAQEAARLLHCPHCQGALRWKEGILEGAEEEEPGKEEIPAWLCPEELRAEVAARQERLALLGAEIQRAQKEEGEREKARLKLEAEIGNLERQIEESEPAGEIENRGEKLTPLTQTQEQEARRRLAALEALEVVEAPPKSSQRLRAELECWRAAKDLESEEEKVTLLEEAQPECWRLPPAELEAQRRAWDQYLAQKAKAEGQEQELKKSVARLEEEISRLSQATPADALAEMAEAEGELSRGEEKRRETEKIDRLLEEHQRLAERRERLMEEAAELEALTLFRERCVQVACAAVQTTVDAINASIADIVSTIFDNDIRIQLQLSREVKSTGRIKHEVSFNVGHQGAEFDTLARLSGGEGDRASLALCLSLNKLSGCPFLMFDETMRSLNADMKELVLEALRENAGGKSVICVVHDVVEGVYDQVVRV